MSGFGFTGHGVGPVRVLAQSAVAVSHTGDVNPFTLASIPVPAGALGKNGRIEVKARFSCTNSANAKNPAIKFGGTVLSTAALLSQAGLVYLTSIANRNALNSQETMTHWPQANGSIGYAPTAAAIDTSAATAIDLTCQLALATETVTLESYQVLLFPAG